jgi:hypothetical protein
MFGFWLYFVRNDNLLFEMYRRKQEFLGGKVKTILMPGAKSI